MNTRKPREVHKENCEQKTRAIIKDKWGNTITLMGQHGFEWSIVREEGNKIVITTFPSRVEARKEFHNYTKIGFR